MGKRRMKVKNGPEHRGSVAGDEPVQDHRAAVTAPCNPKVYKDEVLQRWVISDYSLASRLLAAHSECGKDWSVANEGTFGRNVTARRGRFGMVDADGGEHARYRRPAALALVRARADLGCSVLQTIARRTLTRVAGLAQFDLVEMLAKPYASAVLAELLGIERHDRVKFMKWASDWIYLCDAGASEPQIAMARDAHEALLRFFEGMVSARMVTRKRDFASHLIEANDAGSPLSVTEMAVICQQMVLAGGVTVTDAIGNGVVALLTSPDQFALLCSRPDIVGSAVGEMLRFSPPATEAHRFSTQPIEVGALVVGRGETLSFDLGACNRDGDVFDNPQQFDVTRRAASHLTFGRGAHRCLGAGLAVSELEAFFSVLIDQMPALKLMDAIRRESNVFSGYRHVLVESAVKADPAL